MEPLQNNLDYSEFMIWEQSKIHHAFRQYLSLMRHEYTNYLVNADINDLAVMGRYQGTIKAIDAILTITFEDLVSKQLNEENNEKR